MSTTAEVNRAECLRLLRPGPWPGGALQLHRGWGPGTVWRTLLQAYESVHHTIIGAEAVLQP